MNAVFSTPTSTLIDRELAMYQVYRNIISSTVLREIVEHFEHVIAHDADNYSGDKTYSKLVYSDFFYERHPKLGDVVEAACPEGYRPLFDLFFETHADIGKDHHWHLGTLSAYFMEDPKMLTLWLPTRRADEKDGGRLICSRHEVLGEHLNRLLTYCVRKNLQFSYADMLAAMKPVFEDGARCDDYDVGDGLLFNSLNPHKGEGFRGQGTRSIYGVRYVPIDARFELDVCRDSLQRGINTRLFERLLRDHA